MSDLLINWLNDEVQLSCRITNFQQDFHNGYLFGQLLSKYSQQLNFNQFVDKDDKASRIKNFTLLYDTLKTLRVSYDSNIAMAIIEKKTGIAKKVLYELKMQLEKTTSNAFSKLNKPIKPLSPLKKIPISKDKFDKISKQHFSKQLNEIHRAQKNINVDSHLSKFPQFHQKTLVKAQQDEKKESQGRLLGQMKFRQKQLDNIKKSSQFRNEWQQSNLEKWAANMTVRKMQVQKDTLFKTNLHNTKLQSKTMSQLNAIKSLDKDLKEFEKKIKPDRPKRDSSSQSEQELPPAQNKSALLKKSINLKNRTNQFGYSKGNLNKTSNEQIDMKKRSPQEIELNRHQREKRRRKMMVEQSKKHQFIKIERRQRYIISTLQQNSKQQKQIQYEIWRAWQNKQIIMQNRQAFDEKIKEKQQTRVINAKFKDEQLLKTYRQQHKAEVKDAVERQNKLKVQNSVKQRKEMYNQCRSIMDSFIEMTEVFYQYGQQKNQQQLDDVFVKHLLDEFVGSLTTDKQIAQLQLKNYIKGQGEWNISISRDSQEQSTDPIEQNALPSQVINNYFLGNILKTVFSQIYDEKTQNEEQIQNKQISANNLISLLGLDFAGKNTVAQKIKDTFGFKIIKINELVENKIKDYEEMKSKGVQTQGDTPQLVQLCYEGKEIPNKIILSLLKEQVKKNQKCLVINYPTTYQECIELTKELGNQQPSDCIKKSKLKIKIQQFSRLVMPTNTKNIPRSLKPCGLDFALWLDVSPKTSLDRFLGRRWTPNGECIHINSQIQNPNILQVGDKASPIILKNNFKLKNKIKIESWLKQFGIKLQNSQDQLVQLCWQSLSGQDSQDRITQNALNIVEKALQIKSKKINQQKFKLATKQEQKNKKKERQQFQLQLKEKCAFSQTQQIQDKFKQALNSIKTDQKFLESIENLWNNTQKLTVNSLINVFQALRQQQISRNKHISQTKRKFIQMLTRQDARFYLVKKFQNEYNEFFDQNNDMVNKQYAKQQLHQRVQDLEVDLLTIIQEKKDDAMSERESIMNSGWLESQLSQIVSSAHVLLQTELNRTFSCQQIIQDYYSKKHMVETGDLQQQSQLQLKIDQSLQLIKQDTFPRLQKLVSEAMRLFNKQEQAGDDKNKKGGKPPPKKDDKKAAKKGGGKDQVQENKQPTPEEIQYKKALNTQKAIFRYRAKMISSYANKKMKQFNEAGNQLYSDLEDLYRYTDKVQKSSAIGMTKIFKDSIQQQKTIQNQVQINYTQVLHTQLIRNFEKPKPVIEPASQSIDKNRFTVSGLNQIIKFINSEAELKSAIKTRRLLSIFQQLQANENYRVYLPQNWKHLTSQHHQKFIKTFDPSFKGQIQIWILFQIMCLSSSQIKQNKQLEQYKLNLSDHNPLLREIEKQKFINTPAWFDTQQAAFENVRVFNRNKHLKEILFDIHKSEEAQAIVLDKYIKRLSLQEFKPSQQNQTYFQFAFE